MTETLEQVEIGFIPAPRSASFTSFWALFRYGLPVLGILAGVLNLPAVVAIPVAVLVAWMVPELWPIRAIPRAVLADRLDIPRAMFLSNLGYMILASLTGFGIFHTAGAILRWFVGLPDGLHPHDVLPVALLWTGLWLISRAARPIVRRLNKSYSAEAVRRRAEAGARLKSALRPEMLATCANRRVI